MKKINPETGKPYVCGFQDAYGRVFIQYDKNKLDDGFYKMRWGSFEDFEKKRKTKSEWQKNNKEKHRATKAKAFLKPSARAKDMLSGAKTRAKLKSLEFNLTYDWLIKKLENGFCELSGMAFDYKPSGRGTFNPFSPSIDKIDNNKGYTVENCRVIITALNVAINQWGLNQYLEIAKNVIAKQLVTTGNVASCPRVYP